MKIQESAQDYLESILILSQKQSHVRATDICNYFGYARATVSVFLKQLKENGYVTVSEHNHIYLTDTGRRWDGYKVSVRDKIEGYQEGCG